MTTSLKTFVNQVQLQIVLKKEDRPLKMLLKLSLE